MGLRYRTQSSSWYETYIRQSYIYLLFHQNSVPQKNFFKEEVIIYYHGISHSLQVLFLSIGFSMHCFSSNFHHSRSANCLSMGQFKCIWGIIVPSLSPNVFKMISALFLKMSKTVRYRKGLSKYPRQMHFKLEMGWPPTVHIINSSCESLK